LAKLNKAYGDILARNLENQGRPASNSAKQALKWVACSGRPLKEDTLLEAINRTAVYPVNTEHILALCKNLVDIDSGMARFTHSSVKEFVETELENAHNMAAKVCLDYILKQGGKWSGFGEYACLYWPFHCGRASFDREWQLTPLGRQLDSFLLPRKAIEMPNNLQTVAPQTFGDGSAPGPHGRQIWMSMVEKNNLMDDEQFKWMYTGTGSQRVPDDFRMACLFNWLWFLRDFDATDIKQRFSTVRALAESPLHMAIKNRNEEVVKFFLQHDIDAKFRSSIHLPFDPEKVICTPLGMATLTNQPAMVEILLGLKRKETEEDYEQRSFAAVNDEVFEFGNTALHLAALHNLPEIARILCRVNGIDINATNRKGATPLLDSALAGSKEVASILLKEDRIDLDAMAWIEGPDIKAGAIHCCQSPEIAKMLLERDPKIARQKTMSGYTVLGSWLRERKSTGWFSDEAFERRLLARLDLLLKCDALEAVDFYTTKDKSKSALRQAACVHSWAIFEKLWDDKRSKHDETNANGDTLLHEAASSGNVQVVEFLLNEGADVSVRNHEDQTALMMAKEKRRDNVVKLLMEYES
jgi:ankyrin repeat protein